ncbi:MAG: hypothetical protein WC612_04025 [Bdellovibrionales bacterium]|jgi:hypothetical protein
MSKTSYKWLPVLFLAAAIMPAGEAWAWGNLTGGDHGGAAWNPANGTKIAGIHTNIGVFTVAGGATVSVQPWDGANYGNVTINATNITIAGTLTAAGAGYGGGGGGGGGVGVTGPSAPPIQCRPYTNGAAGVGIQGGANGTLGSKGFGTYGFSIGGAGGAGGGVYGGNGATAVTTPDTGLGARLNGLAGGKGGYALAGGQGDTTTDESLRMGSGGGGGSGGASAREMVFCSVGGSGGGGAGGSGGGFIKLVASDNLTVTGAIQTNGRGGGNGGLATNGQIDGTGLTTTLECDLVGSGGAGGNAAAKASGSGSAGIWGYYTSTAKIPASCSNTGLVYNCSGITGNPNTSESHQGGDGGAGGHGAGGGLMLKADTLSVTGTLNGLGSGSDTTNAGTLKAFYCTLAAGVPSGNYGRYYHADAACFSDSGIRYQDSTLGKVSIAAKKTGTSPVKLYNTIGGVNKVVNVATVATTDSKASKLRVKLPDGTIKALRVYP